MSGEGKKLSLREKMAQKGKLKSKVEEFYAPPGNQFGMMNQFGQPNMFAGFGMNNQMPGMYGGYNGNTGYGYGGYQGMNMGGMQGQGGYMGNNMFQQNQQMLNNFMYQQQMMGQQQQQDQNDTQQDQQEVEEEPAQQEEVQHQPKQDRGQFGYPDNTNDNEAFPTLGGGNSGGYKKNNRRNNYNNNNSGNDGYNGNGGRGFRNNNNNGGYNRNNRRNNYNNNNGGYNNRGYNKRNNNYNNGYSNGYDQDDDYDQYGGGGYRNNNEYDDYRDDDYNNKNSYKKGDNGKGGKQAEDDQDDAYGGYYGDKGANNTVQTKKKNKKKKKNTAPKVIPSTSKPKVVASTSKVIASTTKKAKGAASKKTEEKPAPKVKGKKGRKGRRGNKGPTMKKEEVVDLQKIKGKVENQGRLFDETKEAMNIIIIGHVDSGKSTICGNMLVRSGKVDKDELRKYEIEAKEKGRESWIWAYVMDINEEERDKGKTVEVGKASFDLPNKRYIILDCPGHKNYVPNMIAGAAQADVAALVVSAKSGEFEAGFERAGQTREHAILASNMGSSSLIVIVNKMDECEWKKERFDYIQNNLTPFLEETCGYDISKRVTWVPVDGFHGVNIDSPVGKETCGWYDGGTLFDVMDALPKVSREQRNCLRIPVLDASKEQGNLAIFGKIESGVVREGMKVVVLPSKKEFTATKIFDNEDNEVALAESGDNVKVS